MQDGVISVGTASSLLSILTPDRCLDVSDSNGTFFALSPKLKI